MCQRLLLLVVGFLVMVGAAGCPSDPAPANCDVEQHRLAGTPLTLLSDARLDLVGDTFVLMGSDGNDVRWASLSKRGELGPEHVIAVPSHTGAPLFAVAGTDSAADRLVVGYLATGGQVVGMLDLMTFSVAFDNTMPSLPAMVGRVPMTAAVTMSSGRGGMHAAIAWGVRGAGPITTQVVRGDGRPLGDALVLGSPNDFSCLRFSPGKGDLTVGYVDLSGTPPAPAFVGAEINAAGTAEPSFRLSVGLQTPSCIEVAPNDTGYGLAWHSQGIGTYFGVFAVGSAQFPSYKVLGDVFVSGPPPALGGLAWLGDKYAVLFARPSGTEVWPIDATGHRQGEVPVFPSAVGHTGSLSAQPADRSMYATYADYSEADPASQATGVRFFMKVSCL